MKAKSKIREFSEKIKKYDNVIDFTLGDPQESIHEDIQEATIQSILNGNTHYSTNIGELSLINKIVEKELFYIQDEIYITSGATQGLFEILMSLLKKGDGLLMGIPVYGNYISLAEYLELDVQFFLFDENYQINEEEIISRIKDNTKAILINHPHNPTGTVYNKKSIQIIHKIMFEYNIHLIWDATYYECGNYPTLYHPMYHDSIFQIHTFSKAYKMSGYRIGYNCIPKKYMYQWQPCID